MEEEELGRDVPRAGPPDDDDIGGGRIARFAAGALLLLVAVAMVAVALGSDYYEVTYRGGGEPDEGGEDTSLTHRNVFGAFGWKDEHIDAGGNTVEVVEGDYRSDPGNGADDAPYAGVAMKKVRYTGLIGLGFVALASLAALLHRFGALNFPGPAPVMAAFGAVLLATGIIPFITDIVDLARLDVVPGQLDLVPQFFTRNADGTAVHDLDTGPLLGFWLHLAGTILVPIGAAFTFWSEFVGLKQRARELAEEAAARGA